MSKKKTKIIDRPWWVDQQKWDSLTDEEKVRFIQENQ